MDADAILLHLIIDLVIIIVAARSLGWVAKKLNQPAVIGEIIAGMLLGPTVIGRIWPSVPGQLFPASTTAAPSPTPRRATRRPSPSRSLSAPRCASRPSRCSRAC